MFSGLTDLSLTRSRRRPEFRPALVALEERVTPGNLRNGLPANWAVARQNHNVTFMVSNLQVGKQYTVKIDYNNGGPGNVSSGQKTIGTFTANGQRNIVVSSNYTYQNLYTSPRTVDYNVHKLVVYVYLKGTNTLAKAPINLMSVKVVHQQTALDYLMGRI